MNTNAMIVWVITGLLAGSLAGMVLKRSREGYGWMTNLIFGLLGAIVGGWLFDFFGIQLGLGQITIRGNDVVAAFFGALLLVLISAFVTSQRDKR